MTTQERRTHSDPRQPGAVATRGPVSRRRHSARTSLIALLTVVPAAFASSEPPPVSHDPVEILETGIRVGAGDEATTREGVSPYCLECHGDEARLPGATRPDHLLGPADKSHPVDAAYPADREGYVPIDQLDGHIRLIDGQMTCLTCHDPAAPDHSLAIETAQSRLCLACHRR